MDREEAIKQLEVYRACMMVDGAETDAYDIAIEALEQQPCEDAISRQAVDRLIDELARAISDEKRFVFRGRSIATIMQDILDLPSVSTEKTGHWKWVQYDFDPRIGNWHCSECRNILVYAVKKDEVGGIPIAKYCPNCGAKMGVEE